MIPKRRWSALVATWVSILPLSATGTDGLDRVPVQATTMAGDRVLLHPNGHWEFVDPAKAAAARQRAEQYPENRVRPVDAQGGWLGGRLIMPGDSDYNRGSLNPKMR